MRNKRTQAQNPMYPSVDAFAQHLGMSRQAAYAGLRNNTIPHIRIGKRFFIPKAAIEEWLRSAGRQLEAQ